MSYDTLGMDLRYGVDRLCENNSNDNLKMVLDVWLSFPNKIRNIILFNALNSDSKLLTFDEQPSKIYPYGNVLGNKQIVLRPKFNECPKKQKDVIIAYFLCEMFAKNDNNPFEGIELGLGGIKHVIVKLVELFGFDINQIPQEMLPKQFSVNFVSVYGDNKGLPLTLNDFD